MRLRAWCGGEAAIGCRWSPSRSWSRGAAATRSCRAWAEHLAGLAPRGELVEVDGAAHVMPFSAPEKLAEAILPFLRAGAPLDAALA